MALPGIFPKLLDESESCRMGALAFCKKCQQAFEESKEKGKGRVWAKMLARSFMHMTFVQKVLRRLGDFKTTITKESAAGQMILKGFQGTGQSKIVEDIIQTERVQNTLGILNMTMTPKRKSHVAFTGQVLSKKHNFKEVQWRQMQLTRADRRYSAKLSGKSFDRPAKRKAPLWFKKVVSKSKVSEWPTFRPGAMIMPAIDMFIMQHYAGTTNFERISSAWLCEFFTVGQIIVRAGNHFMVLGSIATLVLLVIKVQAQKLKKYTVVSLPDGKSMPEFMVVDCVDSLQALPAQWATPLRQRSTFAAMPLKNLQNFKPGLAVVAISTRAFLEEAVAHCFWGICLVALRRLVNFLKLEGPRASLAEAAGLLVRHLLKINDNDVFEILALRLVDQKCDYSDLLQTEVAQEAFEDEPFLKDPGGPSTNAFLVVWSCVPFVFRDGPYR